MRVAPFAEMLNRPLARPRFNAFLLSIFGIVALLLATVGLYAVMAAYVRQREREIAIRLAVGGTATRVRQFVLAETVRLAGLGALLGVAGAAGANPLVRGMLFDVDPVDAPTMIGAALLRPWPCCDSLPLAATRYEGVGSPLTSHRIDRIDHAYHTLANVDGQTPPDGIPRPEGGPSSDGPLASLAQQSRARAKAGDTRGASSNAAA
jgi:hypothetical protein